MIRKISLITNSYIIFNFFCIWGMEELNEPIYLTFKNETSYPIYLKNKMRDIHLDPKGQSDSITLNITPFTNEWIAGYDSKIGQQAGLTNNLADKLLEIRLNMNLFKNQKYKKIKETGSDATIQIVPGVSSVATFAPTYALGFKISYNYKEPKIISKNLPKQDLSGSAKEVIITRQLHGETLKDKLNRNFNELFRLHMGDPKLFMLAAAYKYDFENAMKRGDFRSAQEILDKMEKTAPQDKVNKKQ